MIKLFEVDVKNDISMWGLSYVPTIGPVYSDDDDIIKVPVNHPKVEFSDDDKQVLFDVLKNNNIRSILEIGVHRQEQESTQSSTTVFLNEKHNDCSYIGVDIEDKKFINDPDKKRWTMVENSSNFESVMKFCNENNVTFFDLIFIDGWHSVNQVLKDWKYTKFLKKGGFVIFHDTNFHPGPNVVFDAIDEFWFEKQLFCKENTDWGIGVARRIR